MYGLSPLLHRNYIKFGSRNRHDVRCCKSESIERCPKWSLHQRIKLCNLYISACYGNIMNINVLLKKQKTIRQSTMLNIPKTHSSNLSNVQLLPSMYQHDTENQCVKFFFYQKDSQPMCQIYLQ